MRYLALLLFSMSALGTYALNVEAVISRMDSAGRATAIGKGADCGYYVICRVDVEIGNDINVSREQAKLQARKSIAELFSTKVSGKSSTETITIDSIRNEEESFSQTEFSKSFCQTEINQLQRGISVCKERINRTKLTIYCLLTEQVIDATASLEKCMKALGTDTVQTTGIGYYSEQISIVTARKVAIEEAQRNAIAAVLGVSITSTSAKQSISSENIDNNGDETFACDDTFKCRTFSACAGFIEYSRVIDERKTDSAICVTIVAKVAREKLLDDYRSYLESMGNPGFCVRSNEPTLLSACSGFFGEFGLRMVGNISSAAYIIDAVGKVEGETATVTITAHDKTARSVLFSSTAQGTVIGSPSAAYVQALAGMKEQLHANLNQFIGRANADGRKVTVRLCNYDSEYEQVLQVVKEGLANVPGAQNVRRSSLTSDTVEYTLNFRGDIHDLADFLEKHIRTDVKRRRHRPAIGKMENTLLELDFE